MGPKRYINAAILRVRFPVRPSGLAPIKPQQAVGADHLVIDGGPRGPLATVKHMHGPSARGALAPDADVHG